VFTDEGKAKKLEGQDEQLQEHARKSITKIMKP